MANQQLKTGDNQKLSRVGIQNGKFRARFGMRWTVDTWANIFSAASWPSNQLDLVSKATAVPLPGESPYNNFVTKQGRFKARAVVKALGIEVTDPGTEKIRSIIAENSQVIVKVASADVMRVPTILMPPGVGVNRQISHQVSGATFFSESHGDNTPNGLFAVGYDLVVETDDDISITLELDPAARTALAALAGSCPSQGFFVGVVAYLEATLKAGISG